MPLDRFARASLGTSELWGTFAVSVDVTPPRGGTFEVLLRSPKDSSASESVAIPIGR